MSADQHFERELNPAVERLAGRFWAACVKEIGPPPPGASEQSQPFAAMTLAIQTLLHVAGGEVLDGAVAGIGAGAATYFRDTPDQFEKVLDGLAYGIARISKSYQELARANQQ